MLHYITINIISELICLIFAIICLIKDTNIAWRSMIVYMAITCMTELDGLYVELKTHNNQWVYNIFLVAEAGFTTLMFASLLSKYTGKLLIILGLAVFCILYIYELIAHGFLVYNYFTYKVMSFVFVLYSLYFFYLLLKDDDYIRLNRSSSFWWVSGALFFYFGNTACNLFDGFLGSVKIFNNESLTYFIYKVLNVLLYGCWGYSFICRKWETTTSKA